MNVALGLVVVAMITRYLGPTSYGYYVLLLSFGTIAQLTADAGLYLTLSRQLAQSPRRAASLLSNTVSLRAVLLTAAFLVGTAVAAVLPPFTGLLVPFLIIALGLGLQSMSQLYMSVFQYHQTVWRATVGDLTGRAAQIIGIVLIGLLAPTLTGVASMFALGSAVALGLHWFLSPIRRLSLTARSPRSWRALLAVSWPLGLLLLLNAIYFRIDTVVLSLWRPVDEVAWYGLAYRIVESALFFPAMLGGLLLPRLSETVHKQVHRASEYLGQGLRLVLVAAGAALAILISVGTDIVVFIAGPSFAPSGPLLALLSWALAIMFVGNMFGFALVALERQRLLLWLYAALAIGNLIANLLFIPRWGASAAALTTIGTEGLAMGIAGLVVWQALRLQFPWLLVVQVAIVTIGGSLLLGALPSTWHILVRLAVFAVAYGLVVWVSGMVGKRHLALLREVAHTT